MWPTTNCDTLEVGNFRIEAKELKLYLRHHKAKLADRIIEAQSHQKIEANHKLQIAIRLILTSTKN